MFTVNGNFIIFVSFFACSIKFTFAELVNCSNLQEKKSSKNTLVFDFITHRTHLTKFNDFFSWCKMKHVKMIWAQNSMFSSWLVIFSSHSTYDETRYRLYSGVANRFPYAICHPCCRLFGVGFQWKPDTPKGVARLVMIYLGLLFAENCWKSSMESRLPYVIDHPGDALLPYEIAHPCPRFCDSSSGLYEPALYIPVIKFRSVSSAFLRNSLLPDKENPLDPVRKEKVIMSIIVCLYYLFNIIIE